MGGGGGGGGEREGDRERERERERGGGWGVKTIIQTDGRTDKHRKFVLQQST